MALWDFSNTHVTFDNPNYLFDGSVLGGGGTNYVPNLIGLELDSALQALQVAGVLNTQSLGYFSTFPVTVTWIPPSSPIPTVLTQSVYPGTAVPVNSPIALTVVEPPTSVAFP